jgi:hypothetical protein
VTARAALLSLLALAAVACGTTRAAVRTDVLAYLQRAKGWAPAEAEAAKTIDRILRTQFVDEAEVRRQIADNRPRVLAHLEQVRAYEPRSRDVEQIHARYVAAWGVLLGGYDAIEEGFSSGDYSKLARGREAMEAWREQIVGVARELRELADRLGLDPAGARESRASEPGGHRSTQRTKSSAVPAAIA